MRALENPFLPIDPCIYERISARPIPLSVVPFSLALAMKYFPSPRVVSSELDACRKCGSIDCSVRLAEYVDSIINQRAPLRKILAAPPFLRILSLPLSCVRDTSHRSRIAEDRLTRVEARRWKIKAACFPYGANFIRAPFVRPQTSRRPRLPDVAYLLTTGWILRAICGDKIHFCPPGRWRVIADVMRVAIKFYYFHSSPTWHAFGADTTRSILTRR